MHSCAGPESSIWRRKCGSNVACESCATVRRSSFERLISPLPFTVPCPSTSQQNTQDENQATKMGAKAPPYHPVLSSNKISTFFFLVHVNLFSNHAGWMLQRPGHLVLTTWPLPPLPLPPTNTPTLHGRKRPLPSPFANCYASPVCPGHQPCHHRGAILSYLPCMTGMQPYRTHLVQVCALAVPTRCLCPLILVATAETCPP